MDDMLREIHANAMNKIEFPSLLYGEMGVCIYKYLMGRQGDPTFSHEADLLLSKLISMIHKLEKLDIRQGVVGNAIGIMYLVKEGFVEGDINEILYDIDCKIYEKTLVASEIFNKGLSDYPFIDILIYECLRWKQIKNKAQKTMTELFIATLFNYVYINRDNDFYDEPLPYNVEYPLCKFLWCLCFLYDNKIEYTRIEMIFNELEFSLFSHVPILNANRLLLATLSQKVSVSIRSSKWEKYVKQLMSCTDINAIINSELPDKSIFPCAGLSGILLILKYYNRISNEKIAYDEDQIITRIEKSSVWERMKTDSDFLMYHYSLDGLCGVELILNYLNNKSQENGD